MDGNPLTAAGFRGDSTWVHAKESHVGKPYWPGGNSGVTLDPGIDLGQVPVERALAWYEGLLTPEQKEAVRLVAGKRGLVADMARKMNPVLQSIRITQTQAEAIFPVAAAPYWQDITRRFRGILRSDAPPSVHTALLSLAYNRGPGNPGLAVLSDPLERGDWQAAASLIAAMQQDHALRGIRTRRQAEAHLVFAELASAKDGRA